MGRFAQAQRRGASQPPAVDPFNVRDVLLALEYGTLECYWTADADPGMWRYRGYASDTEGHADAWVFEEDTEEGPARHVGFGDPPGALWARASVAPVVGGVIGPETFSEWLSLD